jgi:uncharacterized protein (TIGR03435 family)
LTGTFDVDLEFTPSRSLELRVPQLGLQLAEAFEHYLGLRFERRQKPVDILVIDAVARPSPD